MSGIAFPTLGCARSRWDLTLSLLAAELAPSTARVGTPVLVLPTVYGYIAAFAVGG